MTQEKLDRFLEGLYPKEACTHPKLVYWFSVSGNSYQFTCKECLVSLQISAYEIVNYTRQEWRTHLIELVTQTYGEMWGQKAREWLERTEEPINEPAHPRTPAESRDSGA